MSKDKKREPIKTSHGECFEIVEMRIFFPDRFEQDGDHRWKRKATEEDEAAMKPEQN